MVRRGGSRSVGRVGDRRVVRRTVEPSGRRRAGVRCGPRHTRPVGAVGDLDVVAIPVSRPGTLAVADIEVGEESVTVVSMYGRWENRLASRRSVTAATYGLWSTSEEKLVARLSHLGGGRGVSPCMWADPSIERGHVRDRVRSCTAQEDEMDQATMARVCEGLERPAAGEFDQRPAVRLVTITTAADWLGLSRSKLYELLAAGELPTVRIGRSRRIAVADLEAFVDRRRTRL